MPRSPAKSLPSAGHRFAAGCGACHAPSRELRLSGPEQRQVACRSRRNTLISSAIRSPTSSWRKCEASGYLMVLWLGNARSKRWRCCSRKAKSANTPDDEGGPVGERRQACLDFPQVGRGPDQLAWSNNRGLAPRRIAPRGQIQADDIGSDVVSESTAQEETGHEVERPGQPHTDRPAHHPAEGLDAPVAVEGPGERVADDQRADKIGPPQSWTMMVRSDRASWSTNRPSTALCSAGVNPYPSGTPDIPYPG